MQCKKMKSWKNPRKKGTIHANEFKYYLIKIHCVKMWFIN